MACCRCNDVRNWRKSTTEKQISDAQFEIRVDGKKDAEGLP